jgi:urocanate hydratase
MSLDEIQPRTLKALTALYQIQPLWEGSVILSLGLDTAGSALAIAGNIAGAVTLAIDKNPARLREIVRSGACDFVVNTLDEAIRAMKNEVRKRAPLSVALAVDPAHAISEIVERGLAPQLFTNFTSNADERFISSAGSHFASLGAALVDFEAPASSPSPQGFTNAADLVTPLLDRHGWVLNTFTFVSAAELRVFDTRAIGILPSDETIRRRWLEAAPRILRRQHPPQRSLWLTKEESGDLE